MTHVQRLVMAVALLFVLSSNSWGQARSIQSFVEAKDQWDRTIGANWRLEGRYSIIGKDNLRFVNCPMPFVFGPDVVPPAGRRTNLEVTGKIEKQQGKLVFVVDSIRSTGSDMQRLLIEKANIDSDKPQDWYELAAWASGRARFYDDAELLESARDLQQSGLEVEFRKLEPNDRDGLAAIVKKARDFQLPEVTIEDFLHEGYWEQFAFLQSKEPATDIDEYANLMVSISTELSGARKPLHQYDPQMADAYLSDPRSKYELANREIRDVYERLFYLKVATTKIERMVDASGKNAFAISTQLRNEAPERSDLIEKYMQLGLKYELGRVAVMTRQEMIDLARRFEAQKDVAQAQDIKRKWLLAREALFADDGARGLADYADEWIQLLNDKEAAAKYYIEAWKRNPQDPRPNNWLRDNGWALHKGEWVPTELVPQTMESAIEKAIREGRIERGMSTLQVKTAMGVPPDSIVRFASNGKVNEMWVYESAKIIVRFSWTLGTDQSIVDSIQPMAVDRR